MLIQFNVQSSRVNEKQKVINTTRIYYLETELDKGLIEWIVEYTCPEIQEGETKTFQVNFYI